MNDVFTVDESSECVSAWSNRQAAPMTARRATRTTRSWRRVLTRISDLPVVPYRQDQSPRPDFWGSDVRHHTTEDDTRWVNDSTRRFSSRSTAF